MGDPDPGARCEAWSPGMAAGCSSARPIHSRASLRTSQARAPAQRRGTPVRPGSCNRQRGRTLARCRRAAQPRACRFPNRPSRSARRTGTR
eukprot:scaffold31853_cov71-Phaeocystis_antarctica.AAC.3